MKTSFVFFLVLYLAFTATLISQVSYEALNYSLRSHNEWKTVNLSDSQRAQSLHPNLLSDLNAGEAYYRSYIPIDEGDSAFLIRRKYKERSWVHRKLLKENFIIIDTGIFYVTIDPLFNFSGGQAKFNHHGDRNSPATNGEGNIYTNTRGLLLKADIGSKFSLESYFYENQSKLPRYISDFVEEFDVVPGQGRVKDFKEDGFDYAQSGGYFSYAPWSRFNVQVGHHKFFIGDGYRSLMLSDNSFNYPFLRMNLWLMKNRISYSVIYASFQNLHRLSTPAASESPFERKGGTFHNIDFKATDWLKFNVFQGMIWKTMDTSGKRTIDYNMFNPIAFVNPAIYGLDDENNAIMGLGFKLGPLKRTSIYGQFIVDDNDFNQYAWQLGTYHFLTPKLRFQAEWNKVQPYTYSYTSNSRQSFTHYNQALAHPMGSGFHELLFRINFRHKRFLAEMQLNWTSFDQEGADIFEDVSYVEVHVPGGLPPPIFFPEIRTSMRTIKLEVAYLLNPATNAKLFFNISDRKEWYSVTQSDGTNNDKFFYLGLRTDLRNIYYDF